MFAARDVSVEIAGKTILDSVSLSLAPGEVLAFLGPNGAGKSTLLRALSGARPCQSGQVLLDDLPLSSWSARDLARRRGVLPQASEIAFGFRAFEIVLLGREPYAGESSRERDLATAEAAMKETDVLHLADRRYATLSGGEQQRVQLARVLSQVWLGDDVDSVGNRYLLLDEPTSSLDLSHQHATLELARRWAGRGVGVLAVLHDLNLAAMYADRICILRAGRLEAEGVPRSVLTEEVIERCFDLKVTVGQHPVRDCPYVLAA